jgi:cysteine desulfurase/selenocysteine lyase
MESIADHEQVITGYALQRLQDIDGLKIIGPSELDERGRPVDRGGAISFTLEGKYGQIHPHDIAQFLDARGVAVRGGHHCARPLHEAYGIQSSTRASFYLYTTTAEIDQLVDALAYTKKFFEK